MPLVQGSLDVMVLKALEGQSRHGYGVASWVREMTDDAFVVEEGALYTALHRLERQGLVRASWGVSEANRRAKYYTLTASGEKSLREQSESWRRSALALFKLLGASRKA